MPLCYYEWSLKANESTKTIFGVCVCEFVEWNKKKVIYFKYRATEPYSNNIDKMK